jgi:hypothetical protein
MKKKSSSSSHVHPKRPPPPPAASARPTHNQNQSVPHVPSGFFNTIKEGFAFGIGSSVARQAVNSVFSSSSTSTLPSPPSPSPSPPANHSEECDFIKDMYKKCMERTDGNCIEIIKEFNEKCGITSEFKDNGYILGYK